MKEARLFLYKAASSPQANDEEIEEYSKTSELMLVDSDYVYPKEIQNKLKNTWYSPRVISTIVPMNIFMSDHLEKQWLQSACTVVFNRVVNALEDYYQHLVNKELPIIDLSNSTFEIIIPFKLPLRDFSEFIIKFKLSYGYVHNFRIINVYLVRNPADPLMVNLMVKVNSDRELPTAKDDMKLSMRIIVLINDLWRELSILYDNEVLEMENVTSYTKLTSDKCPYNGALILNYINNFSLSGVCEYLMRALAYRRYKVSTTEPVDSVIASYKHSRSKDSDNTRHPLLRAFVDRNAYHITHPKKITSIPTDEQIAKAGLIMIPESIHIKVSSSAYKAFLNLTNNGNKKAGMFLMVDPVMIRHNDMCAETMLELETSGNKNELVLKFYDYGLNASRLELEDYNAEVFRMIKWLARAIIEINTL